MKPGRELDKVVAEIMGIPIYPLDEIQGNHEWLDNPANYPHFTEEKEGLMLWLEPDQDGDWWGPSTEIYIAMIAFDWLEKNNPWRERETESLALFKWEGKPTVGRIFSTLATRGWVLHRSPLVSGESYPHAISLAILESSKVIRKL